MGFFYEAIKRENGAEAADPMVPIEALEELVAGSEAEETVAPEYAITAAPKLKRKRIEMGLPQKLIACMGSEMIERNTQAAEQCRVLRTRLWDSIQARKIRTLMVTSAMAGDGKTLLSVNLAFALNQLEGVRVLLVDADLRKAEVASFLGTKCELGLNALLAEGANLDEVCSELRPNLDVVLTNVAGARPAELIQSAAMRTFLERAKNNYDVVLLDTAPLFPVADSQAMLPLVDGVLLAVRADQTPYELAAEAAGLVKNKIVGTILNGGKPEPGKRYQYARYPH